MTEDTDRKKRMKTTIKMDRLCEEIYIKGRFVREWRQENGDRRMATGEWRQENGNKRMATRECQQENDNKRMATRE